MFLLQYGIRCHCLFCFAITNDKLSAAAPYSVVPLSRVAHAVIEADADETEAAGLAAAGINILRAV